jgi:hypothetical protein
MTRTFKTIGILMMLAFLSASCASQKPLPLKGEDWTKVDNNIHQIDGPAPGKNAAMAFRVYRSGVPDKATFAKWCGEYKIARVIDMAGTANNNELKFQKEGVCPDIKIVYSQKQDPTKPVTEEFLKFFDDEIAKAKKDGVGILFRCTTGSHRTGRLAAYYQMKYQGYDAEKAIGDMNKNGVMMPLYEATLVDQVYDLQDYINNKPCSRPKACVIKK